MRYWEISKWNIICCDVPKRQMFEEKIRTNWSMKGIPNWVCICGEHRCPDSLNCQSPAWRSSRIPKISRHRSAAFLIALESPDKHFIFHFRLPRRSRSMSSGFSVRTWFCMLVVYSEIQRSWFWKVLIKADTFAMFACLLSSIALDFFLVV